MKWLAITNSWQWQLVLEDNGGEDWCCLDVLDGPLTSGASSQSTAASSPSSTSTAAGHRFMLQVLDFAREWQQTHEVWLVVLKYTIIRGYSYSILACTINMWLSFAIWYLYWCTYSSLYVKSGCEVNCSLWLVSSKSMCN